jgi:Protein of unknown function (DUF2569)
MLLRVSHGLRSRSAVLLLAIEDQLGSILKYWLLIAGLASALRIALASHSVPAASFSTFASYMLVVVAPFASTLLALRWFSDGHLQPQPSTRLARVGRWVPVDRSDAQSHSLYGTSGIMVSLIIGMMVNVPVRAAEYLAAMPPMPAEAPHWLSVLHFAMTFDVVVFTSLYMIAFVAALRRVPLFPRLLVAIWLGDLAMQLATAQMVGATHVPANVAGALHALLLGNVKKVLVSMALWLPYLLLSKRVNVTYRHRIPA